MLLNMLKPQNISGALNIDKTLLSAMSKLGKKKDENKDSNLSEKKGIGTLGDNVTEALTGFTNKVDSAIDSVSNTMNQVTDTMSNISNTTNGLVPNVAEMATMNQSQPGSLLDFTMQTLFTPFAIARNLKAMEDPEKYGQGTMYGTLMGTGNRPGLFDSIGSMFTQPVPTVSPYQGNTSGGYGGVSVDGSPYGGGSGFGSVAGLGGTNTSYSDAEDEESSY